MPPRLWRALVLAAAAVFLGSVLVSMWNDLLAPPLAAGDTARFLRHLAAMGLAFAGLAGVVVGGWLVVRGVAGYTPEAEVESALGEALRARRPAAWRGLALMLLGFACFALMNRLIER